MKTAILYASSRGTTEKAAQLLMTKLNGQVSLINLKKEKTIDLADFDAVILGSSIHAGMVQGKMKNFITANENELLLKKLGLFICCMYEGEKADEQLQTAYPEQLQQHSVVNAVFGGEFDFKKMNFVEKFIIKKMSGSTENVSTLSEEKIFEFATAFNEV